MRNSTAQFKSCFLSPPVPRFARVSKLARLKVMNQYLPSPLFLTARPREKGQREYSESKEREDRVVLKKKSKKDKNRRDFN